MDLTRRETLIRFLFGAGGIGLRALATGLPASFLLNPRKALAQSCLQPTKAQYVIFNTSGGGDPINANCPGTYLDSAIIHSPGITSAPLTLNGTTWTSGQPWCAPAAGGSLPQNVLDRTQFWHIMTNTPVHPKEPQVLELMGAAPANEMLPSLLAKVLAPCLNTLQPQPVALGPQPLSYSGQALPLIPPSSLKDTLANPTGPLTQLQTLRDTTMNSIYDFYKNGASATQQAYIDSMITSQSQIRTMSQKLMGTLAGIPDDSTASQILAAVTLIQMNVAPVFTIQIPFGGDNHSDGNLSNEATQTKSGVASIASLMSQLQTATYQDKVSFISLNVFGRTLLINGPGVPATNGRNHNPVHQVSLAIGKPFLGGVIGGVGRVGNDYGATAIKSADGSSSASGDIAPVETLGAFAQTMLQAVGGDPSIIGTGKVINSVLA